jgi:HK97 family phage prohead protease
VAEKTQVATFQFDVVLGSKAVTTTTEDGDLLIEGYAADYSTDRDNELFEDGALHEGFKAFLDSNPVLLYHHKKSFALGQVLEGRFDAKGMWIKARVDKPEPGTIAADVFRKIQRGTIRAFSVGGKFYRKWSASGPTRIFKADIHEVSVTPQPINARTLFAVGQKAFADDEPLPHVLDAVERLESLFERIEAARVARGAKV